MTIYFTADTHFGHSRIIPACKRPFRSVEEMDREIIARWNSVVQPEDTVYHLGDFCFKGSKLAAQMLQYLQGEIVLLRGNHDTENTVKLERWRETYDLHEVRVDGVQFVLCHYPLLEWPSVFRGAAHLHGHTHARIAPTSLRADVGVDAWNYFPVTAAQIMERLKSAPHHEPRENYTGFVGA